MTALLAEEPDDRRLQELLDDLDESPHFIRQAERMGDEDLVRMWRARQVHARDQLHAYLKDRRESL